MSRGQPRRDRYSFPKMKVRGKRWRKRKPHAVWNYIGQVVYTWQPQ